MKQKIYVVLVCSILGICSANIKGQIITHSYNSLLTGISNNGLNKEKPYVTAGDRTYIIGTMDGDFPDIGDHVEGEMGGIWMHPIKLLDGYYLKISDLVLKTDHWLSDAEEFINYPFGNTFKYKPNIQGLAVQRKQFCPDGQQGVVIQYELSNTSDQAKDLNVEFLAKTDLSPVWFSKEIGIRDSRDQAAWLRQEN